MCGRISQSRPEDYPREVAAHARAWRDPAGPRWNVPPGTRPLVVHQLDGDIEAARLHWGFRPDWSKRGPVSNARLDKVMDGSPFWRGLVARRLIVPADGWFEWTGEKGAKQPWFIHARDGKPVLLAAITAWRPGAEPDERHGFAIVTDDAAGGMLDVHDRRPVALTPDAALEWLAPETEPAAALEILTTARPESAFQWYAVTPAMGNSRYQYPDAIAPLEG